MIAMTDIMYFRFYYGENHPIVGMTLLKVGKICSYMDELQEAVRYLSQAETIWRVTHGTAHPTYREKLMPLIGQLQDELNFLSQTKAMRDASTAGDIL